VIEAPAGTPARVVLESGRSRTIVETCVVEVVPPGAGRPARVRFTMRLCTEAGEPFGSGLMPSTAAPGRYERMPGDFVNEEAAGAPFHRSFSCPGGTGWEVEGIADALEGGGARFTLRGLFLH
jgi:hypothetical protein